MNDRLPNEFPNTVVFDPPPPPKSTRARLTAQLAEARITALELGEVGAAGVITGLMAAVRERKP